VPTVIQRFPVHLDAERRPCPGFAQGRRRGRFDGEPDAVPCGPQRADERPDVVVDPTPNGDIRRDQQLH
jgi:hypothetical protein